MAAPDPVELAQALIRCPSVTPEDAGAQDVLVQALEPLGFECHRLRFGNIDNLYARIGTAAPHFCFAGHTDVVPPGDAALWRQDPFAAEIRDGTLFGRGAADMKSAIAAFVAAAARFLDRGVPKGSISLLITGDEEGPAIDGTTRVLDWIRERGDAIDHCIVGEPTSSAQAGDTLKIGRRGSLTTYVTVRGMQGHVGYPHKALNPIPVMAGLIARLCAQELDRGTAHFEPSTLSFTTVDVGNPATNVIPAAAHATFNIRFNDTHTAEMLQGWVEGEAHSLAQSSGAEIDLDFVTGARAFLTEPGAFTDLVSRAVKSVTGSPPELSTTGGTSDARFIKEHCPVAELGLPGATMHKTDECVPVAEILRLTDVYAAILERYFA